MSVQLSKNLSAPVDCAVSGPGVPGLVSVVVPSFNRAYILPKTIESVLNQTYEQCEILVVDDGSTDDTREVVAAYGDKVRYVHQANGGAASARNRGMIATRGEYIALLDSDDVWFPWKLEAQVRLFEKHPEVGLIWTDMDAVDDADQLVDARHLRTMYSAYQTVHCEDLFERHGTLGDLWSDAPPELQSLPYHVGDLFNAMLRGSLVHTSTSIFRRSRVQQIGLFNDQWRIGEDYEFHIAACYHGPVALLDASTIRYRVGNPDQLTAPSWTAGASLSNVETLTSWLTKGRDRVQISYAQERALLAGAHRWAGRESLRAGLMQHARKHLARSLRLRPCQPRVFALLLLSLLPHDVYKAAQRLRRIDAVEAAEGSYRAA